MSPSDIVEAVMMVNALLAVFLILVAASAAVVISMGALALFDVIFGRRKAAVVTAETESTQLESPTQRDAAAEAKLKRKAFVSDRRRWKAERATGYGSHSQRVRHHR
jgi:predicted membrane protein